MCASMADAAGGDPGRLADLQNEAARMIRAALCRVGALAQLRLESRSLRAPPDEVAEGNCFAVPRGARGAWAGRAGLVALRLGGGWDWLQPSAGWRAWIVDEARGVVHDGSAWRGDVLAMSRNRAATLLLVEEIDHMIRPGARNHLGVRLHAGSSVIAVSGCVLEPLTGSLQGWRIGLGARDGLFARGIGLARGTAVSGPSRMPLQPRRGERLVLSAEAGLFASGRVLLAIHRLDIMAPRLGEPDGGQCGETA